MTLTTPAPSPEAVRKLFGDFSLEMTGKDVAGLEEAAPRIPAGTRINITYLGNEDLEMRVSAARAVRDLGFIPVPHISARRLSSQDQLEEFLERLAAVGATERVFVVGGDPAEPKGPYTDSLSIIRTGLLEAYGVREVSIAGYPDGHPAIATDLLWQHLEDKAAALQSRGLDVVVLTQFGFDTLPVHDWITAVRQRGIAAPIRVGTPGPASIKRLLGFARRLGVSANAMIVKKYGFSLTNLIGSSDPGQFIKDLTVELSDGPPPGEVAVHLYTFGGLPATAEWAAQFVNENNPEWPTGSGIPEQQRGSPHG